MNLSSQCLQDSLRLKPRLHRKSCKNKYLEKNSTIYQQTLSGNTGDCSHSMRKSVLIGAESQRGIQSTHLKLLVLHCLVVMKCMGDRKQLRGEKFSLYLVSRRTTTAYENHMTMLVIEVNGKDGAGAGRSEFFGLSWSTQRQSSILNDCRKSRTSNLSQWFPLQIQRTCSGDQAHHCCA